VAVGVVIKAGSGYETEEDAGVAHMVEHLLFEDSGDETALGPWIEDMGGYVNASTRRDFTQVTVAVASEFLPDIMPRLAQGVFAAQFTEEQVARQRQIIAREMADQYATAERVLEKLIWQLAYTVHPYKHPVPGTRETVAGLTSQEAHAFYQNFYVPSNAALIAVGDVQTEKFIELAASGFGQYSRGTAVIREPPTEPPQTEIRTDAQVMGKHATIVQFAWHAPGIASKAEVCAMDLAYTILGEGPHGWLDKHLCQENQLAVACGVQFLTQREPGLFIITVLTDSDSELAARQAVLEDIEKLRAEPVPEQTLQQAKHRLYTEYAFTNEAYTDQVDTLAFYEAIDSYHFATEYIERVNQVTAADLQAVVNKYLGPDNYNLVIVRPEGDEISVQEAWRR